MPVNIPNGFYERNAGRDAESNCKIAPLSSFV